MSRFGVGSVETAKGDKILSAIAVIPARYDSSRFPGKPLALISGKPMIAWVYERVCQVKGFDWVVVATDSPQIYEAVKGFGGAVEMTSPDHASGTDRVWEVAQNHPEAAYIFNVQGDEPLINPLYLEEALETLKFHHESVDIITLKAPIESLSDREDPNVVKVVTSQADLALYFSRAPIPFAREPEETSDTLSQSFRHVGVYGFCRSALERFVHLPVSALERLEKLEQLRALEAGMRIHVKAIPQAPIGVDTPEDLVKVQALFAQEQVC